MKKNTISNVHLIALIALAYFPINAFSSNENLKVVKIPNSSVNVIWDANKDVVDRFSRSSGGDFFGFRRIEPAIIEHTPTGLRSASTLPATIESTVSRAGVLAGVGKLARLGAKFSTRAVPYVGTALLAHDIYETFKEDIQEQGYQYDPKTDKFVKGYEYSNCIWYRVGDYPHEKLVNDSCYGVDSSTMSLMSDYSRFPEVKELMEARMEILGRKYWEKLRNRPNMVSYKNYNFGTCEFEWNGGGCLVHKGDDYRVFINFSLSRDPKYKEEMDAKKLEEILSLKVDANPDRFIKATGFPGYKEDVKIENGKIVMLGPVTGEDGKPKQIKITFGQDAQGNTTASVEEIQRPDLTPGSAEAPEIKPNPAPTPETNPKQKENPREADQDNPKPTPTPGETPSPNESPKDRREEKKPDGNGGLLCDLFPKILACADMGEPSENDFEGIAIPKAVNEETWSPDNMFPSSGVCPKDKTFHVFGKAFSVSYQPLCTLMENVRFAVIIGFIIMSAFITFGSLRKE